MGHLGYLSHICSGYNTWRQERERFYGIVCTSMNLGTLSTFPQPSLTSTLPQPSLTAQPPFTPSTLPRPSLPQPSLTSTLPQPSLTARSTLPRPSLAVLALHTTSTITHSPHSSTLPQPSLTAYSTLPQPSLTTYLCED